MKLGLISDTHIPERISSLPEEIYGVFKDVDLILHAGDITSYEVLEHLGTVAPVKAVQGNMDFSGRVNELPKILDLTLLGKNLVLTHGWGSPHGIRSRIRAAVRHFHPHVIVHGHTHQPYIERDDGILWINPGSATDRLVAPFRSVGILRIHKDGETEGRIVKLGP